MRPQFGEMTEALKRQALNEWFLDSETNYLLGWGRGAIGTKAATEHFVRETLALPGGRLVGIYRDYEPAGFVALWPRQERSKTTEIEFFLAPEARRPKFAARSLGGVLSALFETGTYRVEVPVLSMNEVYAEFLKILGFREDGRERSAWWMEKKPYMLRRMALLKPDWKKKKARWN